MKNHKEKLTLYIEEEREKLLGEIKSREVQLKEETDLINDIIGCRRAGKTSLMKLKMRVLSSSNPKKVVYVNFESRKLYPLTHEYFNDLVAFLYEEGVLKDSRVYLFLDEVQRVKHWEKHIRSIYDEFKGQVKLFISGSSSKLTQTKLGHLLSGRHLTTVVFPLSFREFLSFNDINHAAPFTEEKEALIRKALKEYLINGGFPEAVLTKNTEIIETLFLDVLNRDISPHVKNKTVVEEVAYFLCSNSGKLVSFSKLVNALKSRGTKISVPTIEKYFSLMKDAFLFFDITIFSYKVKDQLQYPRKIYCIDNGFLNYFGFKFSEDKGRMIENTVAVELYRLSWNRPGTSIFYFKTVLHEEVDFVIKEGLKVKQLIQVCAYPEDTDTKKREVRGLLKAMKEFGLNKALVITDDYEGEETIEGKSFTFVPLWKWLLADQLPRTTTQ